MPKIMPVAIQDKTADFILQMSQGNQALARLYTQLLARYEEARLSEDFKREMFEKGNQAWKDRYDYSQNPQDETERHHPFGSGAPPAANAPPATAAPAARPQGGGMRMIPGAAPIPGSDSFDRSSSAPVTPTSTSAPVGNVPATPGYDSFNKAEVTGADYLEVSAQSRIGQPPQQQQQRTPRGTSRRVAPPAGQLPRGTSMDPPPRRARQPPAQAEFLPIQQEWLQKMHDAETKWKVPHGSVLAVYGFENSGGRFTGKNKYSTAAGIGQFTDELIREYKLDPSVRNDPNVMIDLIARNMSRNARVLERDSKIKLDPSNPQHMPFYTFMHHFGVTDGPLAVRQYLTNPNVPMTSIMANVKKRDGTPRNNAETLANNLIPSNYTVGKVIEQHASIVQPWYDNGLKLMSGVKPSQSAPATTTTPPAATTPTPPADVPQKPKSPLVGAQGQPYGEYPRGANFMRGRPDPEAIVPINVQGVGNVSVHRDAAPAFQGFLDDLIAAGAPIRTVYGQVNKNIRNTRQISQHAYGNGIDIEQQGRNIVSPAFRQWASENMHIIRAAQTKNNIYSGGDWRSPDFGHFEWNGKPVVATTQVAAAKPTATVAQPTQPPAQQVAMRAPKPAELGDVTKGFGVTPSEPLTSDKDIYQLSMFGDPKQAPPIPRLASSSGGKPQVPSEEGMSARSGLDYVAGGAPVVPQASGLAARSDLNYNVPPPQQREAPTVAPYEAAPEPPPVEAPLMEQPQPSPLQAPTPDIAMSDAVPQASSPFDWPTEGMPQSPDITGPAISLQGQIPNAPPPQEFYPPPAFPQVAETSHNYDPNSRAGRRIDYARRQAAEAGPAEPTYMDQLIRSITDRGSTTPHLPMPPPWDSSTAHAPTRPPPSEAPPRVPPSDELSPTHRPPTMGAVLEAIYGSQIKAPYVPPARPDAPPQPDVPPSQIPPSSIFHERPQAVVPVGQGTNLWPDIPRNTHSIVADFQKMREAVEQGRVPEGVNTDYTPEVRYGARPPEGTPNSVMDKIKEMAAAYVRWKQPSVQTDARTTVVEGKDEYGKPFTRRAIPYGPDWMPKQLGAATAPTQQQDDLPPPVEAPPVIQKPGGSSQQPAQMPNMAPTTPPAPKPGSGGAASPTGGPQMMTGAQRKAAASAAAGPGMGFSWVNDDNAVEFDNNPP